MTDKKIWRPPSWIRLFFAADFLLVIAFAVLVWFGIPERKFFQFFDLDEEANLPAWYSSMQLAFAGALVAVHARLRYHRDVARSYLLWLLSALLVFMSLDENAQIHEWVGIRISRLFAGQEWGTFFVKTHSWSLFMAAPLVLFLFWLFLRMAKRLSLPPGTVGLFVIGFALLVGSAEGTEMVGEFLVGKGKWYRAEVCVEELGEMLGGTFILWAGWVLAADAVGPPTSNQSTAR